MNSHSNPPVSVWPDHSYVAQSKLDFARILQDFGCGLTLIAADALTFLAAQWLFRPSMGFQELAVVGNGGLEPVILLANLFWLLAAAFITLRCLMGDYGTRRLFWDDVRGTSVGLLIASIPDFVMAAQWQALGCWAFLIATIPVARHLARAILSRAGLWQIPAAIIGGGPELTSLHAALSQPLSLGLALKWVVAFDANTPAVPGAARVVLTDPDEIARFIRGSGCREVFVVSFDMASAYLAQLVRKLEDAEITTTVMPAVHRLSPGAATSSGFLGRDVLSLRGRTSIQRVPALLVKRAFDIGISVLLLVVLSPLFLVIAAMIRRGDPGPATYAHTRVGKGGILFPCLKFRTMTTDADLRLAEWQVANPELHEQFRQSFKLKDDPRITGIGKWLRRTSLDELPQLLNIVRGEMSLVGPRPVVIHELEQHYGPKAGLYLRVRPGLTGLWQISGRSEIGYEKRVLLDEWYILNWSFWNDIVILIQTVWIVLSGKGAL